MEKDTKHGFSLLELRHLKRLDLGYSYYTRIPNFIRGTMLPLQVGNLTNLHFLDLQNCIKVIDNFHWLSHLSSLPPVQFHQRRGLASLD